MKMKKQDLIWDLKNRYPYVEWLEPDDRIIRRLSAGYRIVIFIFILVLLYPILKFILDDRGFLEFFF